MTIVRHEMCWLCRGTTNNPVHPHLLCTECNGRGYFDVVMERPPTPPPDVPDEPPSRDL